MQWYEILLLVLLVLFVILLAIILIRALLFKDNTNYNKEVKEIKELDDVVSKLGTLVNIVSNYYHKTNQKISVKYLHRIDMDTSGLIAIAKTDEAHNFFFCFLHFRCSI